MPLLKFEVQADYDKVIRLREEIDRLKAELRETPHNSAKFDMLNNQLGQATREFSSLTQTAIRAGLEVENGFKRKIYDASQTVNDFSERIIAQKSTVKNLSFEVKKLGEEYRNSLGKNPAKSAYYKSEYEAAKKALEEEKAALFNLTQEQATARLSVKRLRDEYALLKNEAGDSSELFEQMKEQLVGMGKNILGTIGIGMGVKELVGQMVQVRGEFQQIETSLEVLLGSEEKAAKLMDEVKEFAKVSPLDLKSTAAATQMMLGFNIEAEKVPRYLQAIGDISMGDAQRFNSLTLAFSQMSATGKLMGQDLNQMINAGFNPLQIMADKTGKSIATLKEEMSKGAITSQMVQQAFIDATEAGGKFYQMSEKASKTINGQLSMLQDALDSMFNSLGEQSEGVMVGAIETTTSLIENYETVGKVLAGLVAVYGAYKTAVILNIALTRSWAVAARADATAKGLQAVATKAATIAQHGLNAAMKANPYGLAAAALVALGTAVYAYATHTSEAEEAQKRLNDAISKAQGEIDGEQANIELLFNALKKAEKGTKEYEQAKDAIISQYGNYLQGLINEKNQLIDVEAAYLRVTKAAEESARARALESVTQDAGNTFAEKTGEAQNNIWQTIEKNVKNKNLKDTLIRLVKNDIGNLGGISKSTYDELYKAFGGQRSKTNSNLWMKNSDIDYIKEQVRDYRDATREYDESIADAKLKLGTDVNEYVEKDLDTLQKERDALQKAIDSSKADGEEVVDVIVDGELKKSYALMADAQYAMTQIEQAMKSKKAEAKTAEDNKYSTKYNNAKKEWEEAKAELKKIEADKDKYSIEEYNKARRREEAASAAFKKLESDPTGKTAKAAEKESDKRKKAEQKASDELLALKRQTQQAEIDIMSEGTGKKLKQIELDYQKQMDAIAKSEAEMRINNKKLGINGLSAEQTDALDAQRRSAGAIRDKNNSDALATEMQYMRDYLKEYGTFQQQKLAIAEDYNQKIAKSTNEWERKSLAKQRDKALRQVDMDIIEQKIDWQAVFGGFTGILQEQLRDTLSELKAYTGTDKFKASSAEDKRLIYEAIERIQQQLPGDHKGTLNFSSLKKQMDLFGDALNEYQKAMSADAMAQDRLNIAQKAYEQALHSGTKSEQGKAKIDLQLATLVANTTAETLNDVQNNVQSFGARLREESDATVSGLNGVAEGLRGLASGSLSGAFSGLQQTLEGLSKLDLGNRLNNAIGGLSKTLSSAGFIGQILSAILSILDILGDGVGGLVSQLLDSIFGAVTGILDDILSGDLVLKIGKSLVDGIGGILNTITFGGFNSWLNASNSKWVAETTERLTESNDRLKDSVDRLKDEIGKSGGIKAIEAAKTAQDDQETINRQTLEILQAQMREWKRGSHSNAYHWKWKADGAEYGSINATLADYAKRNPNADSKVNEVHSLDDMYLLTPEQMAYIRDKNKKMWEEIVDVGYFDKREYWEQYADLAGKLEEVQNALREALTQTTFDSMRNSFVDSLMDMKKDAKDFSEDFSNYLMKAVLNSRISDTLDDELEKFYQDWADMAESGGRLDQDEIDILKQRWDEITAKGLRIRDEVASITGYDKTSAYSQEATHGYTTQLSEDTGSEIVGRATALYESALRREGITELTNQTLQEMLERQRDNYTVASDARQILAESFLELVEIRQNTGAVVQPIKEINEKLDKIERNTRD